MTLSYTNYKDQKYFIQQKTTKTGKTSYSCSMKKEGALSKLPNGYEFHENPYGQVFCRKIQECLFTNDELELVEKHLSKNKTVEHFKVYPKKDAIELYVADSKEILSILNSDPLAVMKDFLPKHMVDAFEREAEQALGKDKWKKFKGDDERKRKEENRARVLKTIDYRPEMRFVLIDPRTRVFETERMTYLGDCTWMPIGMPSKLSKLCTEFIKHLNKESFYELI
jgi:hypothetical protein